MSRKACVSATLFNGQWTEEQKCTLHACAASRPVRSDCNERSDGSPNAAAIEVMHQLPVSITLRMSVFIELLVQ